MTRRHGSLSNCGTQGIGPRSKIAWHNFPTSPSWRFVNTTTQRHPWNSSFAAIVSGFTAGVATYTRYRSVCLTRYHPRRKSLLRRCGPPQPVPMSDHVVPAVIPNLGKPGGVGTPYGTNQLGGGGTPWGSEAAICRDTSVRPPTWRGEQARLDLGDTRRRSRSMSPNASRPIRTGSIARASPSPPTTR